MLSSVLFVAAMLLNGFAMPNVQPTVERQIHFAPVSIEYRAMSSKTEKTLIEMYAAPKWGLTVSEAWSRYNNKVITIHEVIVDHYYSLRMADNVFDVLLDGSGT